MKNYSKPVLRIAMSLVFLYFGFQQIQNPNLWTGFVPEYLTNTLINANKIVFVNSLLELTLGAFLLLGLYTRISALILSLHLLLISHSIGFNPLGIRDLGLAIATLSIFLSEPDEYTLDKKLKEKESKKEKNTIEIF